MSDCHRVAGLGSLVGSGGRIAVIDVETTGLYNTDRIVEIAVVTVDSSGEILDEFDTLVNPLRDVGPTWKHGIDAAMLRDAPTFADIAQHVACRIDGAVIAGHNTHFDMRMVGNELVAAGIDIDWGIGLDTLSATRCKLELACRQYRIPLDHAHRAVADARATAALMFTVGASFKLECRPAAAQPLLVTSARLYPREGLTAVRMPTPYLAELTVGMRSSADTAPYIELLDVALSDLSLTHDERRELGALASYLGLDDAAVTRAHREFVNGLIDAAVEDSIVTDQELDQLHRAAALLDVDTRLVARRTDHLRTAASTYDLTPGVSICFTGQARGDDGGLVDRETQIQIAKTHGLTVVDSVTKSGTDLLVAADGDSRSGKAKKARQYGIPVVAFTEFYHALGAGRPLAVAVSTPKSADIALVCVECGGSWIARRRSATPLCADCQSH